MTTKKGFNMLRKVLTVIAFMTVFASVAMADDGSMGGDHYASLGAGLAIGIAAAGGSIGQGKAAAAAFEGIARNPSAYNKIFVPMIIGLALIESLVLYAFVIAFVKIKI
jgi:F-type H+-transporting ATPase subunit c